MIARTINSPGIEINEIDRSDYNLNSDLKTAVVFGFADRGDAYNPHRFNNIKAFIDLYGIPTNEAERYMYNAAKEIFDSNSTMIAVKMPYDNVSNTSYAYTTYKVSESIVKFKSPFEIICQDRSGNTLSALYSFLSVDKEDLLSSYYELSATVFQKARDYISSEFAFDNEYSYSLDQLFGYSPIFYNVSILLNFDETSDLNDFAILSLDILKDEVIKIKSIFNDGGIFTFDDFAKAFFKTFSLKDIKDVYYDLSTFKTKWDFIETNWIDESELSDDFKLPYTGVKQRFEFAGKYRMIESCPTDGEQKRMRATGTMTRDTYDSYLIGESTPLENTITVVDMTQGRYEHDLALRSMMEDSEYSDQYLGILPVIITPINAMYFQNMIDWTDDFDAYNVIGGLQTVYSDDNEMFPNLSLNLAIPLSSKNPLDTTLGTIAAKYFPQFSYVNEETLNKTNFNKIGLIVFKMFVDASNSNKINFVPVETFIGSLDRNSRDSITGESMFIDNIINEQSKYINVFSNVKIDKGVETYVISKQIGTSLGFYDSESEKIIGVEKSIFNAMDIAFDKLKNSETERIDVIVDAGMSNIAQFIGISNPITKRGKYEPQIKITGAFNNLNRNVDLYWRKVIQKYDLFCQNARGGDCMFICDAPRSLCLIGNQRIVRHSAPKNTIEKDILPYIKYLTGFNTSFGAGYCDWFRCIDDTIQTFMWLPPTVKAIGVYFRCEPVWLAPAGLNRGLVRDSYDVAFNPAQKESDFLYVNNWNYALAYPRDGIFLAGQKTFQTNKTAFDRVNVRRLFNEIKRNVKTIARRFLYDQLTTTLLEQFRYAVNSYLSSIALEKGCSEYYIICDERNNTAETIENNELHCSIGVKPIKSLEFIILNFICTNQSANVEEITSEFL